MAGLTLDHFVAAGPDLEQAQYRILGELQATKAAFARNLIYPYLGELIQLHGTLNTLVQRLNDLNELLPGEIREVDLERGQLIYDRPDRGKGQMGFVEDLIRWAMPHIQETIEEGRTIFEFVDDNLRLEEVGIVPSYIEEGYLIVPDGTSSSLHVLQYTLSIVTGANERYRSLKTTVVKSLPQRGIFPSPHSIKMDLVSEHRELPNPATYLVMTELDFPFEHTVLPVAKRKLMRYLYTQGGVA